MYSLTHFRISVAILLVVCFASKCVTKSGEIPRNILPSKDTDDGRSIPHNLHHSEDDEEDEDDEEEDYEWLDKHHQDNTIGSANAMLPSFDKKKKKSDQDSDALLQSTLRWWEKVPTKSVLPEHLDIPVTTPTIFTSKKPLTNLEQKVDPSSKRDSLPLFLSDPMDAYIIRSKSAQLSCRVVGADKAYFTCNGEAMAAADRHREEDHVEVVENDLVQVKQLTIDISRNQVEEFFGQFTCRCDAWSTRGMASSKNATVEMAYLRKEFEVPPYSQSVELKSQIELRCHPPKGVPKPRIYWLKDRVEVQPERDPNYIQAADGHLIIIQAREKDRANYTCVAENIANRRLSPPARLNVHVTGGWSEWSEWSSCSTSCGSGFQRRDRVCDNPTPMWGGALCEGAATQKNKCSTICPDGAFSSNAIVTAIAGGWTTWTAWSTCNPDCVRHRRRTCTNPEPENGGAYCKGLDHSVDVCTGGMCREKRQIFDHKSADEAQEMLETDFSLLVGLSVALTVFLVVTVTSIKILRRKGRSPSMYTMTNLNYRREFSDKKDDNGVSSIVSNGGSNACNKVETKFGNVMASRSRVGTSSATNTVDILNGVVGGQTGFDIDNSVDKKTPATLAKFGGYDVVLAASAAGSMTGSPYVDKKLSKKSRFFGGGNGSASGSKALLLFGGSAASPATSIRSGGLVLENSSRLMESTGNVMTSSPRLIAKTVSSPTCSEHQYDIPFGHLSHATVRGHGGGGVHRRLPSDEPDYDDVRPSSMQQQQQQHRTSNHSDELTKRSSAGTDPMNNVWAASRGDSTLLQPRLIDGSTGNTPLLGRWSGSDKSLNTSIYSESDRPLSSLFGGDVTAAMQQQQQQQLQQQQLLHEPDATSSYRQSLSSCSLDPDSFTFASVGFAGSVVTLPDLGVSLTIPEGALDRGYTEEIFLAVMMEGRDRPRISHNQTLLSPVVLAGPPRLTFRKPVVLSFSHCADVSSLSAWEMGVYHCDSLFSDGDDTPWVKLSSIGGESISSTTTTGSATLSSQSSSGSSSKMSSTSSRKSAPSILVHLDRDTCYIMTDFLSRFCIVGQTAAPPSLATSAANGPNSSSANTVIACPSPCPASKLLRLIVFARPVSASLDFSLVIQVVDNTSSSVEAAMRSADKAGFGLVRSNDIDDKRLIHFYDGSDGEGDLHLSVTDCSTGWSLRPLKSQQTLRFSDVWSAAGSGLCANYNLHHVDPTVQSIAFKLTVIQGAFPNELSRATFSVHVDVAARLPSPLDHNLVGRLQRYGSATSASGDRGGHFKLPPGLKNRLCKSLDSPKSKGLNDWRALAAALRLEKFSSFFASRSSPTEAILTLWEAMQQQQLTSSGEPILRVSGTSSNILIKDPMLTGSNPLADLLNHLRNIGREDVALMIEKDFSPWI